MEDYGTRSTATLRSKSQAESVVERLYLSIEHLCTAQGYVRKRLAGAIMTLLPLRTMEFPDELQEDFDWVMEQSTKYKSQTLEYEGNIEATMRRIRNSTGEKIAKKIYSIYSRVQDIRGFSLLEYRNPND